MIPLGTIIQEGSPDFVIDIVDSHCSKLDKRIAVIAELSGPDDPRIYHLIKQRGFTYKEYLTLWDMSLPEDKLHYYPINQFLKIRASYKRTEYTLQYSRDKMGYVQLLKDSAKNVWERLFGPKNKIDFAVPLSYKAHWYIGALHKTIVG